MPCTCFLVSIRRSSFNVWTYELLQRRSFRSIPSTFLYRLGSIVARTRGPLTARFHRSLHT
jgi:hypothetical protein